MIGGNFGKQGKQGECLISPAINGPTSSLALVKAASISSSGFQTLGTPASSYLKRSSNEARKIEIKLA